MNTNTATIELQSQLLFWIGFVDSVTGLLFGVEWDAYASVELSTSTVTDPSGYVSNSGDRKNMVFLLVAL